jgi:nitroreductase
MLRTGVYPVLTFMLVGLVQAQELQPISLDSPDLKRGLSVMEALSVRASVREWSSEMLNRKDLSDLLWAANGVNRPESGKRTAPSALNAQDIDVYVLLVEGAYLYEAPNHVLKPVANGDFRALAGLTDAPVYLILVSDLSRFQRGSEESKASWARIDSGIVSQNISLFCAATGLNTLPRSSFPELEKLRQNLNLGESQHILLNHPVGYARQ